MRILIGFEELNAKLLSWIFPFDYLNGKVCSISRNPNAINYMVKVSTAVTRMQTYYKAYDSKFFLFMNNGCGKCISVNGHFLIMNKM